MIQSSESRRATKEMPPYAETVYQLLAGARDSRSKKELKETVARAKSAWKKNSDAGFRSILRAAGAFAMDNDGYFFRYREREAVEEPKPLLPATHLLVFPVPVEPRMRVAYSYAQGLFLKHLYARYGAIPREVREGWAELIASDGLPEADELWAGFLSSGVAEVAVSVSARGWISGYGRGRQGVDDAFLSEAYLVGLAKTIVLADRQRRFHPQILTIPGFHREDLGELANREYLRFNDAETDEFRKRNKSREWSTVQVYRWLEERAETVPEFKNLVEETITAVSDKSTRKEISLLAAAQRLEELLRTEFVPLMSNQAYTDLAVPDLTRYLLLWALVYRLPEDKADRVSLLGWDLSYLRGLKEAFDTPELRGSLKFMGKNRPGRGSKPLVKLTGFDKLRTEARSLPEGAGPSVSAPFELWNFEEPQRNGSSVESGDKVCTVCGKGGELSETGILPESKKRHYDNPQANRPAEVCARCVQVWSIAPITTADDSYAVVEVPTESFLELFALYESLEGINRLETLKTLNRVASLSVFPNKYLLLSRNSGRGKMPQVAQYYLQLARQPHFVRNLDGSLEVLAAQDRAELAREVALMLSVLRRLPQHYATSNDEKVPAISIINALDRGQPYEALYVVAERANKAGIRERQAISGGTSSYDKSVVDFSGFFSRRQKGVSVRPEAFQEVIDFSNYLDDILRPVVRDEVNKSKSRVSGIARKYTDTIREDFLTLNPAKFEYLVSSYLEGIEWEELRKNSRKGYYRKKDIRELIRGSADEAGEPEVKRIEQELKKYFERNSSEREWKSFLEAVERRTLSLLLLNVDNVQQSGQG